jgi:hypothetical protein
MGACWREKTSSGHSTGDDQAMRNGISPAALAAAANGDIGNLLVASTPGGIEAQEAREQQKAVAAQRLPIDGTNGKNRAVWESLGFLFKDDADDLFVNVIFPAGWKLEATDHAMWNTLFDDKGRRRAGMFYKGTFYDRRAQISLDLRFTYGTDYESEKPYKVVVRDCGKVIHTVGSSEGNYEDSERLNREAKQWLDEKYPDHENPLAHWE